MNLFRVNFNKGSKLMNLIKRLISKYWCFDMPIPLMMWNHYFKIRQIPDHSKHGIVNAIAIS